MKLVKYKTWDKKKKKLEKLDPKHLKIDKSTELLAFTGIKDKKGTEIYEYDIVHMTEDLGSLKAGYYIVYFHQGCFMITKSDKFHYVDNYLWVVADKCEVVKNYFEHKDAWIQLQIKSMKQNKPLISVHLKSVATA